MLNATSKNQEITVRSNEEFSKNYKRANQDGIFGPVAVGNINEYNGRWIINLCMKTLRSGERNASFSQPTEWRLKFGTGEYVNVLVENGFIKKLMPIVTKSLTSQIAKLIEESAGGDVHITMVKEGMESVVALEEKPN